MGSLDDTGAKRGDGALESHPRVPFFHLAARIGSAGSS